jgi:hypothetical protein
VNISICSGRIWMAIPPPAFTGRLPCRHNHELTDIAHTVRMRLPRRLPHRFRRQMLTKKTAPPASFHRPVTLPDGAVTEARFRTVRLRPSLIPNGKMDAVARCENALQSPRHRAG